MTKKEIKQAITKNKYKILALEKEIMQIKKIKFPLDKEFVERALHQLMQIQKRYEGEVEKLSKMVVQYEIDK